MFNCQIGRLSPLPLCRLAFWTRMGVMHSSVRSRTQTFVGFLPPMCSSLRAGMVLRGPLDILCAKVLRPEPLQLSVHSLRRLESVTQASVWANHRLANTEQRQFAQG